MKPRIRIYRYPGVGNWTVVTVRYATAKMASDAYQRLLRKTPRGELGIYRHGPPEDGGTQISIVSLNRQEVERAARHLVGAEDVRLPDELVDAMVVRRARVVVEAAQSGASAGRIKIRHAGAGARLEPDGTMTEQIGGDQ
jgi:hypothetical protein